MEKVKIVYNACFGGFHLSEKGQELYMKLANITSADEISFYDIDRKDPILVEVVEQLGPLASSPVSKLQIWELNPGDKYRIDEYDGLEAVYRIQDYKWSVA